jgi:hypothetical protein
MVPRKSIWAIPESYLSGHEKGIRLYRRLSAPSLLKSTEPQSVYDLGDNSARTCAFADTDESAGEGEQYLFQVWHNTMSVIVSPNEACCASQ